MEVFLNAVASDLINNEETIIKNGPAYILGDNHLSYVEDYEKARHEIHFNEDSLVLIRSGESGSHTKLKLHEFDVSSIKTMYGDLVLDSYLVAYEKNDDYWMVEYKLFHDGNIVTHTRVVWNFKGL